MTLTVDRNVEFFATTSHRKTVGVARVNREDVVRVRFAATQRTKKNVQSDPRSAGRFRMFQ